MGKHVNELRRKTSNDSLSKRAKELVKKWRSMVLPESNGQIKTTATTISDQDDVNLNKNKKRPNKDISNIDNIQVKRAKLNGMSELEFSDNSNSSFKDVINSNIILKTEPKRDVILINSDSNSSMPEGCVVGRTDPQIDQQMPKKRGRKKGSKNHKNLIDEAETSFSNKLAVSRGNSKVKTTQELIASLQNKNTNSILGIQTTKIKEDLNERAAKLTERVSIIDQKLNTNASRLKLAQRNKNKLSYNERNDKIIESGSVINDKSLLSSSNNSVADDEDDDIIVVCETESIKSEIKDEPQENQETDDNHIKSTTEDDNNIIPSLSIEDALAQLPPIDKTALLTDESEYPKCTCFLKENKPDFSVDEEDEVDLEHRLEFIEDHECPARIYIEEKYHLHDVTDEKVKLLHDTCISNVNGNYSIGIQQQNPEMLPNGLYVNVVPNVNNECVKTDVISDFSGENFKKYSISECEHNNETDNGDLLMNNCTNRTGVVNEDDRKSNDTISNSNFSFREWHQVTETSSYNGEILKILPYVIID